MGQDSQAFSLSIEDDGIGMLNTEPQPGRYGLASMQERVRRYDGELTIHSPIKKGVRLEVRIPLKKTSVDLSTETDRLLSAQHRATRQDRKSVVSGTSVATRSHLSGTH